MNKKIMCYRINQDNPIYGGNIIGIDLTQLQYSRLVLSKKINENIGKPIRVLYDDENIPEGFVDVTSIMNWDRLNNQLDVDHMSIKNGIVDIVKSINWSGLTNTEKDIVIKYFAYDDESDPFLYLVYDKGYTAEQAKMFLVKSWHKHHEQLIVSYKKRWNYAKLTVATFLSFIDGQDLFNTVNNLIYSYSELGVLGRSYGDGSDGLLDFIESKENFIGNGLREKDYDIYQNNWDFFINELKNVLVFGIYNSNE